MCHTMSISTAAVILEQLLTSSSLKLRDPSSRSAFVKHIFLLIFFSSIWLLYLSGMNGLAGFTLSGFGTARPCCCCCCFNNLSYLIPLQYFNSSTHVTFYVLVFTFFILMTPSPLSMLCYVLIFLERHAIRRCSLSTVG